MVRSQGFSIHQTIGDPAHHVRRMMDWNVDELIVLDIGDEEMKFEHHRTDYKHKPVSTITEFINLIAVELCIPLTFGGRIRNLDQISHLIRNGADKVAVNTALKENPEMISQAAHIFGSQAIVASIDYKMLEGRPIAFVNRAETSTDEKASAWARYAESLGAGEILLNAIDRDGEARGYDLETVSAVADAVSIPVIACGGAGHQRHFRQIYDETPASAAAAGNIFHFKENAYPLAKEYLKRFLGDIR